MIKTCVAFLISVAFVSMSHSQYLWYENETNTTNIDYKGGKQGHFFTHVENPDSSGLNANVKVSKYIRNTGTEEAYIDFNLYQPIKEAQAYSVSVLSYIDLETADLETGQSSLRVYFQNSNDEAQGIYKEVFFTEGRQWQTFRFDFEAIDFSQEILNNGGYNQIRMAFIQDGIDTSDITYYFDQLEGTTQQSEPTNKAEWLAGSWGITFPIYGGPRLDSEINNNGYDYRAGAQEIVDNLPNAGHVMANLGNFAASHEFLLRMNDEIGDVGALIHESCVPSLENEQVILDVLHIFKNSGKKVILYVSISYFSRASDEAKAAWKDFYTKNYGGDQYAAYKDLIKGYVSRLAPFADAYWLDTGAEIDNEGKMADFIAMIKATDPGALVSANRNKNYFTNVAGTSIMVDTDGLDDDDSTDYKIVLHEPLNSYQDFTNGHVTPLAQGAPPNSWGYDEFTLPNMIAEPWFDYQGMPVLKHAWFPIRERWHVEFFDLVFGLEQAYRFTKSLTDAGASITWANTTTNETLGKAGHMMADEMAIMKEINDRLQMDNPPDFVPYKRPPGALLVGETLSDTFQYIVFPEMPKKVTGNASFSPGATASSGLPVSYTSSDTTVAIILDGEIHIVTNGTSIITASQEGDSIVGQAEKVTRVLTIEPEALISNNLALSGTATQSSNHPDGGGEPYLAIDGNTNGSFNKGSVTRTNIQEDPWWQVDFGANNSIGSITVFGRSDACCNQRLYDYSVFVLNASGDTTYKQRYTNNFPVPSLTMDVGGVEGQIVKVQQYASSMVLNLAEVQVFNVPHAPGSQVTFKVTDAEKNDLPYVLLAINDRYYTSNYHGEITLNLIEGEFPFTLSKKGYHTIDQTLAITNDTTATLQMIAKNQYNLAFHVNDDVTKENLSGVQLSINNQTYTTNAQGEISLKLYEGEYGYTVSKAGYDEDSGAISVSKDTSLTVFMSLQTGLNNLETNEIKIYPNPVEHTLTILLEKAQKAKYEVCSLAGESVLSGSLFPDKNAIEIGYLSPGIYLVKVVGNDNVQSRIIIKK